MSLASSMRYVKFPQSFYDFEISIGYTNQIAGREKEKNKSRKYAALPIGIFKRSRSGNVTLTDLLAPRDYHSNIY